MEVRALPPEPGWQVESARWRRADGSGGEGLSSGAFVPEDGERVLVDVTYAQGCLASREFELRVRPRPRVNAAFVSGDHTICSGDEVELVASAIDVDGAAVERFEWDLDGELSTVEATRASTGRFRPNGHPARVIAIDSFGCGSSLEGPIERIPLPAPVLTWAEGAEEVCEGREVRLDASGSLDSFGSSVASYLWDLDRDWLTAEGSDARSPTVTAVGEREVRLRLTDANGCSSETTAIVRGRAPPTVRLDFEEGDRRVCDGDRVTLTAAGSTDAHGRPVVRFEWDLDGDGSVDLREPRLSETFHTPRRFALSVADELGCQADEEVSITIDPLPLVDAGPDRRVAAGGSVLLMGAVTGGTPDYRFAWSPAPSLDDPAALQPRASPWIPTDYTLTVVDANGCRASDVMKVRTLPRMRVRAGEDRTRCTLDEEGVTLQAITGGGIGGLRHQWTAVPDCGSCIASSDAPSTVVRPVVDTTFTVTVTDENGTSARDSVFVRAIDHFVVDAGPDRAIDPDGSTRLGAPPIPGLTYEWSCDRPSCGLSDPSDPQPLARPEGTTVYTVKVGDGTSCTGSDSVLVAAPARILSAMPSEGFERWPRDAPLWVVFDADLDLASLTGNVFLLDPSDGRHVYIRTEYDPAHRMLIIHPLVTCSSGCTGDKPYGNNFEYLLVLKGGPGGISTGGPLPMTLYNDLTLRFVASSEGDGAAPALLHRRPASRASEVPRETFVVMRFDEHVDPRTVNESTIWIEGGRGKVHYDILTRQALLQPEVLLDAHRTYTVRVQGVTDARSSPTRTNLLSTSWSFQTTSALDDTPPLVVSSTPVAGATGWDVASRIQVRFSEPVDITTLGKMRLVDASTGEPIPAGIEWDDASLTASVATRTFLEPGRRYLLEADGVKDFAGHALTGSPSSLETGSVRYSERFEADAAGWSLSGGWDLDYQAAWQGRYGLGDSPGGNYDANDRPEARSPRIDVSGLSSVTVSLWARRTLGAGDAVVLESSPDGRTWTQAVRLVGCRGWTREDYNFPTVGPSFYLRWRLESDAAVQLDGWFLDELVVR